MIDVCNAEPRTGASPVQSWLRALELTAPISRNPCRILPAVIEELAGSRGDAPALLSERECLTYRELAGRCNQYTRWALQQGIRRGDVVGLLMPNRPEYLALWLGITGAGGVVALLNTNLAGASLAHCIQVARPSHLIVATELLDCVAAALPSLEGETTIWSHGADHPDFQRIDKEVAQLECDELSEAKRPRISISDRALYIYTSGTTGLPKAANVSHGRILQWCCWFAGMIGIQPNDRMYDALPMYHSIGGVLAPGAALVAGGSVVIRESFSAGRFWDDIVRWDCTMFQYIGEFCRYLLHSAPGQNERRHRVRIACGNGMSPDVWQEFKDRFQIPRILEFYASTEGGLSLFNVEGEPGSIGRVPAYLAHRFSPVLVRVDSETAEPIRDAQGFCIPCKVSEAGEALARVSADSSHDGGRFEGYTDADATERKLLRNVLEPGDVWVRTGDLMRKDERGFFYFVDRVGDTFRWKGENVATTEVAEAIASFPGVRHAIAYGVKVGGADGKIGMAALTVDGDIDLTALRRHLIGVLPSYARPAFLRLRDDCETTGTLKYSKARLVCEGFNPDLTTDAIYFDNPETQALHPLDRSLYERIQSGQIRL